MSSNPSGSPCGDNRQSFFAWLKTCSWWGLNHTCRWPLAWQSTSLSTAPLSHSIDYHNRHYILYIWNIYGNYWTWVPKPRQVLVGSNPSGSSVESQLGTRFAGDWPHPFTSRNLSIYLEFNFKLWNRLGNLDRFISQQTFDHILWGWLVDLVVMDTCVSSNHCGCINIPNISAQCAKVLYLLYTTSTLYQGRLKTGVSDPARTSVISPRPRNHLRCRT